MYQVFKWRHGGFLWVFHMFWCKLWQSMYPHTELCNIGTSCFLSGIFYKSRTMMSARMVICQWHNSNLANEYIRRRKEELKEKILAAHLRLCWLRGANHSRWKTQPKAYCSVLPIRPVIYLWQSPCWGKHTIGGHELLAVDTDKT